MGGLFNSTTLDVMVGLIFVYILLAIMCSSINEWIAGLLRLRARTLTQGITELLNGQEGTLTATNAGATPPAGSAAGGANAAAGTARAVNTDWLLNEFERHPLITAMKKKGGKLPSYIPSRTFATALMDIVTPDNKGPITFIDLENGVKKLPDGDVKKSLLALIQNAQDDLEKAQKNIEDWYDDTMGQVSGWYKRKTALVTIGIALFLTVTTNADTIQITRNLWTNPTVRAQLVEESKAQLAAQQSKQTEAKLPEPQKKDLESLGGVLPTWELPHGAPGWLERLLGWLLTVAAVSLGAPFWFDLLNKLANLRNAGQKPEKSST